MPPALDLAADVSALGGLGLEGLRAEWRRRLGEPPRLRSVELLRHMLAYRIQAAALGDLDRETRRALRSSALTPARTELAKGVRVVREHRGVEHAVEVVEGGFRYRERTYESLSAIAREITGVRWNGWRFFGLNEDAAKVVGR